MKYEDISKAIHMLRASIFLATFDFKSGYHNVSVNKIHQKYFGFSWNQKFYEFTVLPFGFMSAPFIFTKLFKPLLARWRSLGINMCLYLDDGLVCGESAEDVDRSLELIRKDLKSAGVLLATEKCQLEPSPTGSWLGFDIDLANRTLAISRSGVEKAVRRLTSLRSLRKPSLRERMRCTGTIVSMWFVIGSETLLRTRALNAKVANSAFPLDWHIGIGMRC